MKAHFLFLIIFVLVGCESQGNKQIRVTKLDLVDTGSEAQLAAIKVADDVAKAAGYNLSDYRDRTATLAGLNRKTDFILGGRWGLLPEPDQPIWFVNYEPKILLYKIIPFGYTYVTNRFVIEVDARTRIAGPPSIAEPD